ncbi:unnamed protein product, partial [Meganyctiphanes norvegica]
YLKQNSSKNRIIVEEDKQRNIEFEDNKGAFKSVEDIHFTRMFYVFVTILILLLIVVLILSTLIFVLRQRMLALKCKKESDGVVASTSGVRNAQITIPPMYLEPLPCSTPRVASIHFYEEIDEEFAQRMLKKNDTTYENEAAFRKPL